MVKIRLKRGDTVKVICGNYLGRIAKVEKISRLKDIVYLESISRKKLVKKMSGDFGGGKRIILIPIHISNVKLLADSEENS